MNTTDITPTDFEDQNPGDAADAIRKARFKAAQSAAFNEMADRYVAEGSPATLAAAYTVGNFRLLGADAWALGEARDAFLGAELDPAELHA